MTNGDQRYAIGVIIAALTITYVITYVITYKARFTLWLRWRLRRPTFHSGPTWPREREAWLNRRPGRRD